MVIQCLYKWTDTVLLPVMCLCQVLTIGATNLAQELDQALLRPGRFEVSNPCWHTFKVCCSRNLGTA